MYLCVCGCVYPCTLAVVITTSMKVDPATGLSTTASTLRYAATKEDVDAVFACVSTHGSTSQGTVLEPFPIHCKWKTVLAGDFIVYYTFYYSCPYTVGCQKVLRQSYTCNHDRCLGEKGDENSKGPPLSRAHKNPSKF